MPWILYGPIIKILCKVQYFRFAPVFKGVDTLNEISMSCKKNIHFVWINCCCHKTVVCNGDQLLNFSILELVQSLSMFSKDPEVIQNCTGFTLCSSAGLAVGKCSAVMGLTPGMLCVLIYCVLYVLDYYLLTSQL